MRFPLELWDSDKERVAVLSAALESASHPMAILDAIGNVVYLNQEARALWDEPEEALINRAAVSLLGVDERRRDADSFGAHLDRGQPWESTVHPRQSDGQRRRARRRARLQPIVVKERRKQKVVGAVLTLVAPRRS